MTMPPITINNDSKYYPDQVARMMRDYAAAVRAATIEECAKVCEGQAGSVSMFATSADARAANHAVKGCAAAIRALK